MSTDETIDLAPITAKMESRDQINGNNSKNALWCKFNFYVLADAPGHVNLDSNSFFNREIFNSIGRAVEPEVLEIYCLPQSLV